MKLTDKQIKQLVEEYKEHCGHMFDDLSEITEEKVISDLKEYVRDLTDYQDFDDVPFEELLDIIRY